VKGDESLARPKSITLTEAELKLMDVLWEKGELAVKDVVDALPDRSAPAYNSVLTILRILERKGYVRHRKEGRAFVYRTVVARQEARAGAVQHLVRRFFENSHEALVLSLLEDEAIDHQDLERLRKAIDDSRKDSR